MDDQDQKLSAVDSETTEFTELNELGEPEESGDPFGEASTEFAAASEDTSGDKALAQSATQALETTGMLGDSTIKTRQNQAKDSKPSPLPTRPPTLAKDLDRYLGIINDLLAEKEQLQLYFLEKKVPRSYYVRWKQEGNDLTSLVVGLYRRRQALRRKTGG